MSQVAEMKTRNRELISVLSGAGGDDEEFGSTPKESDFGAMVIGEAIRVVGDPTTARERLTRRQNGPGE